ncbi:DUF1667 domain-containing protein [Acetobacterium woodii]|uniref:Transcriptional regulator n=1 Tax=Acetobacterium woodii (strain ATCC 29683 / DSM 1030 / JCM 2381 / KCTC 1655 / WB1) TaxID=931626 RepID=H6LII3_ACEWD|nr:DUF1667 domain-containing protein [Acetobacterium woodii]AFA48557.1 transcriptional regulator [Acetobacterium woodii DSM 1030]
MNSKKNDTDLKEIKVCCTTCPKECVVTILVQDDTLVKITGEGCKRGKKFAQKELTDPERTLTSTVVVRNGETTYLLPVKTAAPIAKKDLAAVMTLIRKTTLTQPCDRGDVVIPNICNSGVDVIACRSIKGDWHAC